MVSLQNAMLGAPTSLASIMVIGPHHAAVTHVGNSSEVLGQREHMVRQWAIKVSGETIPRAIGNHSEVVINQVWIYIH
jgi:hypothetical protein